MGTKYEQIAAQELRKHGYEIVAMNYRCKRGEIDIVARDGAYLVFAEVKYRANSKTGVPEMAVDYKKQVRICRVADYYMQQHGLGYDTCVRFDVIAILGADVTLYKNAFSYISR